MTADTPSPAPDTTPLLRRWLAPRVSMDPGDAAAGLLKALAEGGFEVREAGRAERAETEVARLREALEPFADEASRWDHHYSTGIPWTDDEHLDGDHRFTVGNLRQARAALAFTSAPQPDAITDCYYSPTGKAYLDEQQRCSCVPAPQPDGGGEGE